MDVHAFYHRLHDWIAATWDAHFSCFGEIFEAEKSAVNLLAWIIFIVEMA